MKEVCEGRSLGLFHDAAPRVRLLRARKNNPAGRLGHPETTRALTQTVGAPTPAAL
jgi:hypothetical protein